MIQKIYLAKIQSDGRETYYQVIEFVAETEDQDMKNYRDTMYLRFSAQVSFLSLHVEPNLKFAQFQTVYGFRGNEVHTEPPVRKAIIDMSEEEKNEYINQYKNAGFSDSKHLTAIINTSESSEIPYLFKR